MSIKGAKSLRILALTLSRFCRSRFAIGAASAGAGVTPAGAGAAGTVFSGVGIAFSGVEVAFSGVEVGFSGAGVVFSSVEGSLAAGMPKFGTGGAAGTPKSGVAGMATGSVWPLVMLSTIASTSGVGLAAGVVSAGGVILTAGSVASAVVIIPGLLSGVVFVISLSAFCNSSSLACILPT